MHHQKILKHRLTAALGQSECDLIIKNVSFLDVFSCQWKKGDVAVVDGFIVGLESGLKAKQTIDASGKWLVPGFIDAHVHLESSMMKPENFESVVLKRGTTTAICDPHELANVKGPDGIQYFLDAAEQLSMDLWVMLSSCVPATHMETNGGGIINAKQLEILSKHSRALGLAEMMNMPGVVNGDPDVLEKIITFSENPIDGHCPLLNGLELSAYASTGISTCHECTQLSEAQEKLTKGISIWIREGSVAKDLKALAPLLNLATSTSIGFCTDDRNPLDIATEGHIDHLIRHAIQYGVPVEVAYRSASWSVARHYGLASGASRVGAIAPGYAADFVLLDDAKTCALNRVFKRGKWVEEIETAKIDMQHLCNSVKAITPESHDLEGPTGQVHVIGILEGKIITENLVMPHDAPGVAKLSVLERYGKGSKPANGYVSGFGENLRGAIASSVGHDSHNLIVVGDQTDDMRTALSALIEVGGGFCVVRDKKVLAILPLRLGGLMSDQDPSVLKKNLEELKAASYAIGCVLPEPFLQLAFLSLPVIPSLKLTDRGLVDVDRFCIIDVRAS